MIVLRSCLKLFQIINISRLFQLLNRLITRSCRSSILLDISHILQIVFTHLYYLGSIWHLKLNVILDQTLFKSLFQFFRHSWLYFILHELTISLLLFKLIPYISIFLHLFSLFHYLLFCEVEVRFKRNINSLALDDLLWSICFSLHIKFVMIIDLFKCWFLSMSQHFQFFSTFLDFRKLHLFFILFLHQDVQRLCLFVLFQKLFKLLIRFFSFLFQYFQILYLFLYLLSMLLFFLLLQTFAKLLFKCCFFSLFHLLILFYFLHFFLKPFEILIDLLYFSLSSIRFDISLWKYTIYVLEIKLHLQSISLFLLNFAQLITHDLFHHF